MSVEGRCSHSEHRSHQKGKTSHGYCSSVSLIQPERVIWSTVLVLLSESEGSWGAEYVPVVGAVVVPVTAKPVPPDADPSSLPVRRAVVTAHHS
jgi:hypothetical protein